MSKVIVINSCQGCRNRVFYEMVGKGYCLRVDDWIDKPLEIHEDCPLQDLEEIIKT